MKKRILTYDDLYKFYFQMGKSMKFDSSETGYQLAIRVPMTFDTVETSEDGGLNFYGIRAFHLFKNRNGSSVPREGAEKAMKNMAYKPVLANFCEYVDEDGNTVRDFTSHDMEWIPDETEEEGGHYEYLERQIGCFTADVPYFEEDKTNNKTYIRARIAIPNEYTDANEIIKRKKGSKFSVELGVNELEWDNNEKALSLTDFDVMAITALGSRVTDNSDGTQTVTEVQEGMEGAGIKLEDFSSKNNSIFSSLTGNENSILIEIQKRLSELENNFFSFINTNPNNKNSNGKEGENLKLTELLEKYHKTLEELTFDYESLTDEELEAKFAEMFEEGEESSDPEEISESEENEELNENGESDNENEDVVENMQRIFEISHEDIRWALYQLLTPYDNQDDEYYYIEAVYDNNFVYSGWKPENIYRQGYVKTDDTVSFDGERVHLNREYLTDSELIELNNMRENYEALVEFKANAEFAELHTKREEILGDEKYSCLKDNSDFKSLSENMDNYSLTDLEKEAKVILADYVTNGGQFASFENHATPRKGLRTPDSNKKNNRYGSIFSK